jgi:hypothetical protein
MIDDCVVFEDGYVTIYNLLPGTITAVLKFLNERIAKPVDEN